MVLLGDGAQAKARFGLFEDSANLDVRQVHGLHRTYHRLGNLMLVRLEIVLVYVQDRCMVCAERNTDSKIVLDTLNGTAR
jgi:hypothetical protein